jgi:hypothetical protein
MQADVTELFEDLAQNNPSDADTSALDDFLSSPETTSDSSSVDDAFAAASAASSGDAPAEDKPKTDRTPEDLLSEFEKMLG